MKGQEINQPIAEGESIILLDPEDDKEFLYRMRAKGQIFHIENLSKEEAT